MSKLKFLNPEQVSQQKSSPPLPFPAETANILDPQKCVQPYLFGLEKSNPHNKYVGVYFFFQCQLLSKESCRVLYQASEKNCIYANFKYAGNYTNSTHAQLQI